MKRLIFVEGLPGTGKTIITQKISDYIVSRGENVITLFEDDGRIPSDFYELAGIPIGEFRIYNKLNPETPENHYETLFQTENYIFLKLNKSSDKIAEMFRKWDMGDEHNQQVNVSQYISCALERWDYWVNSNIENHEIAVIDSGFLQNPINELLFRKATDQQIFSFIQEMIKRLNLLNPLCFYLRRESAEAAISFAKRVKGPNWASKVDLMLSRLDYPDFFKHRFETELGVLPLVPHVICSVTEDDWSDADAKINCIL